LVHHIYWSDIVCTDGYLINLVHFDNIISIDKEKMLVYIQAGITLEKLNIELAEYGLALS
jgi:FAD/FMN-containing dehydrogenase